MNVSHPLVVRLAVLLGGKTDVAFVHCGDSFFRERLDAHEPLFREARLDHRFATVALANGVRVVLDRKAGLAFELGDDALARLKSIEAGEGASDLVEVRGLVHYVDRLQLVALTDCVVVGIVRGRDLDRSSAELGADPWVGDDGNLAPDERHAHAFALQVTISFVDGVDGDGHVAEHRLRPRGCDKQRFVRADDPIWDGVELA